MSCFFDTGDCRKPALFLLVKKEGPNKGKHFYTCDTKKCNFFLWENDAKPREREALMTHNCRSENGIVGRIQAKGEPPATPSFPRSTNVTSPKSLPPQQRASPSMSQDSDYLDYSADEKETQKAQVGSGTSSQTLRNNSSGSKGPFTTAHERMPDFASHNRQPTTPSAKRKRGGFVVDSDEEFGGDDLDDSDMERELAAAADESVRKVLFKTPAAERTVDRNGLPTPSTRIHRNSLLIAAEDDGERSKKRQRFAEPDSMPGEDESRSQSQSLPAGQGHALYIGDVGTPTPYRKTDAFTQPSAPETPTTARLLNGTTPSVPSPKDYPRIADEVMALLEGQPEAIRRSVQQALVTHEKRVKGVAMGRDAARAALGVRDTKIAELQSRVVALENSRRMDRGRLRELSEGLLSLTQEEGE